MRQKKTWRTGALALLGTLLLAVSPGGCARAPAVPPTPPIPETDPATSRLLKPGDIVELGIWREPDLSGRFEVDETGTVVFPLLGPKKVTEHSPESLKTDLVTEYQVYLQHPSIDVKLLRRVNVLGAVQKPGLYPVDPTMTIADALALAGGATPIGNPDTVWLIRDGKILTTEINRRTTISDLPIRSGDQFFVPERSWFSRNSNVVATALSASVSLIIALALK